MPRPVLEQLRQTLQESTRARAAAPQRKAVAGLYAITPESVGSKGNQGNEGNQHGSSEDNEHGGKGRDGSSGRNRNDDRSGAAGQDTARLLIAVRAAVEGGARVVQYRNKHAAATKRLEHAIGLAAVCAKFGALFIVNDDVELALEVDADGVHLGKSDGDIAKARKRLGPQRLLGASCYNDLALAQAAHAAGVDHIAFGSMFASGTKPGAVRAPLSLFAQAQSLNLPMVAIGGITAANAGEVIAAGASAVAVISDLFDAPDIGARAAQIAALFP